MKNRTTRTIDRIGARWSVALRCAGAIVTLGCAVGGAGCNYVGAAAYLIEGPPKVDAAYKLDDQLKTVVFVDDRTNAVPRRSLRLSIGESAEQEMIAKAGLRADMVIPSQSTLRATAAERLGEPLSVVDIGRMVGADVVIYASVKRFTLSGDGVSYSPIGEANVKVFDVANNRRVFPPTGEGYPVTVVMPTRASELPQGTAERSAAEDQFARVFGVQIARTFYTHERDALSGRLDD
jgi:hypothetical protein